LIDTHCHLDACEPPDAELVERARGAGVSRLATVGTDDASIERALAAARSHEEVFAIVGRHPHETAGFGTADLAAIERAAADPRARAIGETGLDYYRDYAPHELQRQLFQAHLAIAEELRKAVVIHCRDADADVARALGDFGGTVVLHCFSSSGLLGPALERGYYVSFAGNVTYPNAERLRDAARAVPQERILAETDSPYLAPQPRRGRPNEPANVVHTVAALADARGEAPDELAAQIDENASRAFALA
jgi:TatD DNase family protein